MRLRQSFLMNIALSALTALAGMTLATIALQMLQPAML